MFGGGLGFFMAYLTGFIQPRWKELIMLELQSRRNHLLSMCTGEGFIPLIMKNLKNIWVQWSIHHKQKLDGFKSSNQQLSLWDCCRRSGFCTGPGTCGSASLFSYAQKLSKTVAWNQFDTWVDPHVSSCVVCMHGCVCVGLWQLQRSIWTSAATLIDAIPGHTPLPEPVEVWWTLFRDVLCLSEGCPVSKTVMKRVFLKVNLGMSSERKTWLMCRYTSQKLGLIF